MSELETVIEDSMNDLHMEEPVETTEVEAVETKEEPVEEIKEAETSQVGKVEDATAPVEDEFSKKFGIPSQSVTGRENRIPYSRVKKIVEKNERELREKLSKEFEGKSQPRVQELETKLKGYEERISQVSQFEEILDNDPRQFLSLLSQHPSYKAFFDYLNEHLPKDGTEGKTEPATKVADDDPMPQPNKKLADGSLVYDMDGLQKLMDWQSRQTEARVTKSLTSRFEPIEKEYKAQEYTNRMRPVIDKQIAEARTWPGFNENEEAITEALVADKALTLDGAYRKVVVIPKLTAPPPTVDEEAIRAKVIAELKQKSGSTSVAGGKTVPKAAPAGPRSLEDVITAEIQKLKQ